MQFGFLLSQGSEFAFVIFSIPAVHTLLAVALTLAATASLAETGRTLVGKMRARAQKIADAELVPLETAVPVLIFGIGARGRSTADALIEFDIPYLAIESDDRRLRDAIADGYDVVLGNFGDPRLWKPMAIEGRKFNIFTEPQFRVAANVMPAIQHQYPDLPLLAAVTDDEEATMFNAIGVQSIKDPFRDGVELAAQVLTTSTRRRRPIGRSRGGKHLQSPHSKPRSGHDICDGGGELKWQQSRQSESTTKPRRQTAYVFLLTASGRRRQQGQGSTRSLLQGRSAYTRTPHLLRPQARPIERIQGAVSA
jgi:TrkA-N domain